MKSFPISLPWLPRRQIQHWTHSSRLVMIKTIATTTIQLCMVIYTLTVPTAFSAEDWPRGEVAELATELTNALQVITELADDGSSQPEALQEKNFRAALIDLRQLITDTRELETMLLDGDTMHQTLPKYRLITRRRKSVRFYAESTVIDDAIRQQADTTMLLFEKLDAYYK
jgi:hypothetical protein